jgi:hypothetical protein
MENISEIGLLKVRLLPLGIAGRTLCPLLTITIIIFSYLFFCSLDYFSPRRGFPGVLKFCMGVLTHKIKI